MSYENRMEESTPRDERLVTVRRGFCHVFGGETYRYGCLATMGSPEYLANKSAWMLAPAALLDRGAHTPPEPVVCPDEPAPEPLDDLVALDDAEPGEAGGED